MKLEDFPLDILTQILNDDTSFLVIDLWKCGSTVLNGKLRRGVVSISLRHTAKMSTTRYPRCLKEFVNLQRLSIVAKYQALCSVPTFRKELKKLSSTLTELKISALGATSAFFGGASRPDEAYAIEDEDDEPPSAKRSKQVETADADAQHEEIWNLDVTWPHMKRFSLGGRGGFDNLINASVFALLPRSLEYLKLNPRFNHQLRDFSTLPSNLTTLILADESIDETALKRLPPSLTDIGLSVDQEATILLAKKPSLLPNLVRFPYETDPEATCEIKDEIFDNIRKWPRNIKVLTFLETNAEMIFDSEMKLPAEMEHLSISCSYSDYDLNAEWLKKLLPKTVTELNVEKIDFSKITSSMWPPHMKKLTLSDPKFGAHVLHKLPRTLINLECQEYRDAPSVAAPASLDSGINAIEGIDNDLWNAIKPTLKDSLFANGDAGAYISAVESGLLFGFPLTLETLNLCTFRRYPKHELLLPPRLRELTFVPLAPFDASEFFRLLPPYLTVLRLEGKLNGLLACVQAWDAQSVDPSSTWLSKSKILNLEIGCNEKGVAPLLKYLPRGLRGLVLTASRSRFSTQAIRDLPQNLQSLVLMGRFERDLSGWIDALPRSLTVLSANIPCEGSDLAKLPPNLTSLDYRLNGLITLENILSAPKTLSRVCHRFLIGDKLSPGSLSKHELQSLYQDYQPFYNIFYTSRASIEEGIAQNELLRDKTHDAAIEELQNAGNEDWYEASSTGEPEGSEGDADDGNAGGDDEGASLADSDAKGDEDIEEGAEEEEEADEEHSAEMDVLPDENDENNGNASEDEGEGSGEDDPEENEEGEEEGESDEEDGENDGTSQSGAMESMKFSDLQQDDIDQRTILRLRAH